MEEKERRNLASFLHDKISQELFAAYLQLNAFSPKLDDPNQSSEFDKIKEHLVDIIKETKTLTFDLSPPVLYDFGLQEAMETLKETVSEKYNVNVQARYTGDTDDIGDEWGMLNDYTYLSDPLKAADSRWVHRSKKHWDAGVDLTDQDTLEWRFFNEMLKLINLRKTLPALRNGGMEVAHTGRPHLFGYLRAYDRQRLLIINNVPEAFIIEMAEVDQGVIDAVKQAMEEAIWEKERLAAEEKERKKKEAEGPALENIPADELLAYIESIREIMEFSDQEKEFSKTRFPQFFYKVLPGMNHFFQAMIPVPAGTPWR